MSNFSAIYSFHLNLGQCERVLSEFTGQFIGDIGMRSCFQKDNQYVKKASVFEVNMSLWVQQLYWRQRSDSVSIKTPLSRANTVSVKICSRLKLASRFQPRSYFVSEIYLGQLSLMVKGDGYICLVAFLLVKYEILFSMECATGQFFFHTAKQTCL